MSYSFDPALLWLWHRMEDQVLIQLLAGELTYVKNEHKQNKKKEKEKRKKKRKEKERKKRTKKEKE